MTQFDKRTCRPCDHLSEMARRYPQAWAQIDDFRAAQGYDLRRWADWCYIPLAATYAIASNKRGVDRIFDVDAMRYVGQLAAVLIPFKSGLIVNPQLRQLNKNFLFLLHIHFLTYSNPF